MRSKKGIEEPIKRIIITNKPIPPSTSLSSFIYQDPGTRTNLQKNFMTPNIKSKNNSDQPEINDLFGGAKRTISPLKLYNNNSNFISKIESS